MIRVELPFHLRTLARLGAGEVELEVNGPVTQRTVVDAIEAECARILAEMGIGYFCPSPEK